MTDQANTENGVDWETVYWELTPRLYNFLRYRTGEGEAAQDLTARTLLRAWRYRERYSRDLGAFEAWLFSIARNVANDHLRERQASSSELPLEAAHALEADFSVEYEIQRREDAARLYALIAALPAREQEVIALKYGAGLTNRAIAELMALTESNVGTILHRIVHKLRAEWPDEHEPAE